MTDDVTKRFREGETFAERPLGRFLERRRRMKESRLIDFGAIAIAIIISTFLVYFLVLISFVASSESGSLVGGKIGAFPPELTPPKN